MKTPQDTTQMVNTVDEFLEEQGFELNEESLESKLAQIIQMMETARSTQSALYSWEPAHGRGPVRSVKNFMLKKIKNIVINILEKYIMRQQKFNELTYQAVIELAKEIEMLKDPIDEQKSSRNVKSKRRGLNIKSILWG